MFSIVSTIIVVAVIVYLLKRKRGSAHQLGADPVRILGGLFLLLSVMFFWYSIYALNRNFALPFGWASILISAAVFSLVLSYVHKARITLVFGLAAFYVGLSGWLIGPRVFLQTAEVARPATLIAAHIFLAIIYFSLGSFHSSHPSFRRFYPLFTALGLAPILFLLFTFSTRAGLGALEDITHTGKFFASLKVSFTAISLGVLALVLTVFAWLRQRLTVWEAAGSILIGLVFAFLALSGYQTWFTGEAFTPTGFLWTVIFNAVCFFVSIGYILMGMVKNEEWPINLGVVLICIFIVIKYFDWMFSFLDKSVFFVGAGLLLLGLGLFLERGRRNLLSHLKKS